MGSENDWSYVTWSIAASSGRWDPGCCAGCPADRSAPRRLWGNRDGAPGSSCGSGAEPGRVALHPQQGETVELVHEFTFTAELKAPVAVGAGPFGDRSIFEVVGGEVTGERIRGKMGTGGADWILAGDDGFGRLDVRATLLTDDGASIYVQYLGVIE